MTDDAPKLHTFQIVRNQGAILVLVFRHTDERQVEQVALLSLMGIDQNAERIGPAICEAFDLEYTTRPNGKPH